MKMTVDQFTAKYNNKPIDFDGAYGDQCVDLVQQFSIEVLKISPWGSGNAIGRWANYPKDKFTKIPNSPSGVPQKGDVLIWGKSLGEYGHIAVFLDGDAKNFRSFDQNFPLNSKCHVQKHNYNGLLGWLRPIDQSFQNTNTGGEQYMKFPLYKDKRDGKIYYKLFNLAGPVVQYIGSPADLTTYWGPNAPITDVDNINQVGVDIAIIDRDNNTRAEQIKQLEAAVETLKGQVNSLQTDVTNLRGDLKARTAELEACRASTNTTTLDAYSAAELVAAGIRKFLGLK